MAFAVGDTIRRRASSGSTSKLKNPVCSRVAKHLWIVAGEAILESSMIDWTKRLDLGL